MTTSMRILLDTNILIPLQDSYVALQDNLVNFVRLASLGRHQLLYHPASEVDINRDTNVARRQSTLARLRQYSRLENLPPCPWNTAETSANDACDNEILYALYNSAVHILVTEDHKLHAKAKRLGLNEQVFFIQAIELLLISQLEPDTKKLPNIQEIEIHTLTPFLADTFFDSLREAYPEFDQWFRRSARNGRRAWVYKEPNEDRPSALCIFAVQWDEIITDDQKRLPGAALKLCTFKVGEQVRGRKIGELFLKAAFQYATTHRCENIFIHANPSDQPHLIGMLEDFGFEARGNYRGDVMYVKNHPIEAPAIDMHPFEYTKKYYPHFRDAFEVQKIIIPIIPRYHRILFPDYQTPQQDLPMEALGSHVGNAIKLAYLSKTPTRSVNPGDLILFYRSRDLKAVTTLGVVEKFEVSNDPAYIESLVSKRTVYTNYEIRSMAKTPTKVMLFRIIGHLPRLVTHKKLARLGITNIVSYRKIEDGPFSRILESADW
jgi:GNAT superfamily N-acetyltransferase/rRNA-processing protein FCF1